MVNGHHFLAPINHKNSGNYRLVVRSGFMTPVRMMFFFIMRCGDESKRLLAQVSCGVKIESSKEALDRSALLEAVALHDEIQVAVVFDGVAVGVEGS
jgi:hypothetical protein